MKQTIIILSYSLISECAVDAVNCNTMRKQNVNMFVKDKLYCEQWFHTRLYAEWDDCLV